MRLPSALALGLVLACVVRADDSFTRSLTPADFKAAGLDKLSAEELARLDALVSSHKEGAVTQAKEETTKAVAAQVREQVKAEVTAEVTAKVKDEARKQSATGSLLNRMKVMLTPGTEIEYSTLDATLVPPFHGWQKGTIFNLSNGQRWVAVDDDSYWAPLTQKELHVRIVPGSMGSFFMEIENGGRPRVKFLGGPAQSPAAKP